MARLQEAILRVCYQRRLSAAEIAQRVGTSAQSVRGTLRVLASRGRISVADVAAGESLWTVDAPRQRRIEVDEARRVARIQEWLALWERHMRAVKFSLGFPATAAGFTVESRIRSWEDVDDGQDSQIVRAMDAAIDSLPGDLKAAVYRTYNLTAYWPHETSLDDTFRRALDVLLPLVDRRIPVAD